MRWALTAPRSFHEHWRSSELCRPQNVMNALFAYSTFSVQFIKHHIETSCEEFKNKRSYRLISISTSKQVEQPASVSVNDSTLFPSTPSPLQELDAQFLSPCCGMLFRTWRKVKEGLMCFHSSLPPKSASATATWQEHCLLYSNTYPVCSHSRCLSDCESKLDINLFRWLFINLKNSL